MRITGEEETGESAMNESRAEKKGGGGIKMNKSWLRERVRKLAN